MSSRTPIRWSVASSAATGSSRGWARAAWASSTGPRDTELEREVALKVLPPDAVADAGAASDAAARGAHRPRS